MSRLHYPFGTLCRIASQGSPLPRRLPPPRRKIAESSANMPDRHYLVTLALVRQPSQPLKNGDAIRRGPRKRSDQRERREGAWGKGHEGIIRVMTDLEERPQKQTRRYHGVSCFALHSLRRPRHRRCRNGLLGGMLEIAWEKHTYSYLSTLLCMRQQKCTVALSCDVLNLIITSRD